MSSVPFSEYESISNQDIGSDEFLENYGKDLIVDGKIVSSSTEIIQALARKMKKNPKAVQLLVKRKLLGADSKKKAVIETKKDEKCVTSDGEKEPKLCVALVEKKKSIQDTYKLEEKEIFEIVLTKAKHRNRVIEKQSAKPGWVTKLSFFLFQKTRLSCKFDFKNAWVTKDEKIMTAGECECGSLANISFQHNSLAVSIKNIAENFPHKRSYQIRGALKEDLVKQLKHGSAQAVQSKFTNDLIPDNTELNTEFNPFVTKLNALRLMKHKNHKTDADPIDVLSEWKDNKYRNIISALGLSPFYIFYRTVLQLSWYIVESRKRRISISIDATGSLVRPPSRSQKIDGSEKLKHVFLYTIMAKTATKSVPIAQMLSQDQSSDFIIFFLKKTFRDLKTPVEIVCDESKALLKALSIAFAKYEKIEDYISACVSSLENGTKLPKVYIRIDRSHFVKNVTRKIKDRDFRRRNLFRGVIGYLISCDNFASAKEVIQDFFTLIMNENDGQDEFQKPLPSEDAKIRLLMLCSTHDETIDYASDIVSEENSDEGLDFNANIHWVEDITKKVVIKKGESYHHSVYYCTAQEQLMYVKLFSSITLWSNVMNRLFGSSAVAATSSDVESYFKSLKSGIFERKLMRVDEFFAIHNEFINSEIKLNAISNNDNNMPTKRDRSNSLSERSPVSDGKQLNRCYYTYISILIRLVSFPAKRKRSNSIHENLTTHHGDEYEYGTIDLYVLLSFYFILHNSESINQF